MLPESARVCAAGIADDYRMLRQTQATFASALGMTPAARMAIKASGTRAAFDLASAMARPDEPEDIETVDGEPHGD